MYSENNLDKYYQYLLAFLFFFVTISVFISKLFIVLITLIWFFSGIYKLKISSVFSNSISVASIAFFIWLAFSLLWTENLSWGLRMLAKMIEFAILIPILLSILRYENFRIYLYAFIMGVIFSLVLILLDYSGFKVALGFGKFTSKTPLMSSISQGIFFAFAIFISLNEIYQRLNSNSSSKAVFLFWVPLLLILIFILFDSDSRAGQIGALVAYFVFFIKKFKFRNFLILFFATTLTTVTISYLYSNNFKTRVDRIYTETKDHLDGRYESTSIGQRLYWYDKSIEIINDNFWLGVGIGDYKENLTELMKFDKTSIQSHTNPHNMYLLIFASTGFIGLLLFLNLFFIIIHKSLIEKNNTKSIYGLFLGLLFLTIMLSDSYLLGHYTQTLFVLMLAGIFSKPFMSNNEDFSNYSKI